VAPQFSDLLAKTDVRFFKDRVKCLYPCDHLGTNAPTTGTVHLESSLLIEYDCHDLLSVVSLVFEHKQSSFSDKPYDIPLDARGQAETAETLRVEGHPRIFVVGDSSTFRGKNGKLLPATAQAAFQQADFAGWNLWAAINDRPLLPFRFVPYLLHQFAFWFCLLFVK
ncbi:hypothetical protein HAX54_005086, partial [Datura stramonium]|nr:hypothetical protein [Datura stramonium]